MRLCCIALALAIAAPASADTPPTLDQAIESATATGKPLLVEMYTDWCGPCRLFEQQTLPEPRVQQALESVTFIRYNAEQAPGDDVAARFGIDSYPTFLAIDKHGVERLRHEGSLLGESGVKRFVEVVAESRAAVEDEATIRARLAAAPGDAKVRLATARWYLARGRAAEAVGHFETVARSGAGAAIRAEAWGAATRIRRGERWRRQLVDEKVEVVRRFPATAAADDLAIATVGSGLPADEVRSIFAIVTLRQSDADALNSSVYVALAAGALDEALYGALKSLGLKRDAQRADTLAEVHHVRGEKAQALKLSDEAFGMARGTSLERVVVANRKRFESGKGDSREVKQLRLRTADLWKRAEQTVDVLARRVADPDEERQSSLARAEQRQGMEAERKLEREIASACKSDAAGVEQAIVRVQLDAAGKVSSSVQLHEPGATDALRRCIDRTLADATLPGPANMRRRSLGLSFKR